MDKLTEKKQTNKKYYICPYCTNIFYVENKSNYKYKFNKKIFCSYMCKNGYIKKRNIIKKVKLGDY